MTKINLFARHYPQLKSTAIADNPELQRIRQLTDVQSNVNYEDFDLEMFCVLFFRRNIVKILMKIEVRISAQAYKSFN